VPVLEPAQQALLAQALAQPAQHLWLLSSSEAVGHLTRLAPGADWSASQALASHARIAASACALGFGRVREVAPAREAVLQALRALSIQSAPP
jgi:uroporphyrinogen-III synthase